MSGATGNGGPVAATGRGFLSLLFAVALALRLAAMLALDTPALGRDASAWSFGHEPACIAQALLDGRGYSDPWGQGTGPTAWLTPPYPLLLAGCFALFGGVGGVSAAAVMVLQSLASALTCVLLVTLGREVGSQRLGALAGWLFALYPVAISNSVQLVWDTTFVACALTAVVIALLRIRSAPGAVRGGLAYGGLLLLNPAPISLLPVAALFAWRRAGVRGLAAFVGCAFAVCAPWLVRNQLTLGAFSLRPNFGVELRIGNHDDANGRPVPFLYHPSHVASELALYRELGEVRYSRENLGRALDWIGAHPGPFAGLTQRRIRLFWFSEPPTTDPRRIAGQSPRSDPQSWIKYLAFFAVSAGALLALPRWRTTTDAKLLVVGILLCFGVPYYASHVSERYRFPIDPLFVLLDAALVLQVVDALRRRKETV